MKILVLATDIPATSRMPGSPRLFNLCRELGRHHELILAARCSSQDRYRSYLDDPASPKVFKRIEILPEPCGPSWWGHQQHRLRRAAYFETRYQYPGYFGSVRESIRALCREEHIDLIYVDLIMMAQYVDPNWRIPAVADLHDSMTHLATRMARSERGWGKRLAAHGLLMSVRRLERGLGKVFDLIITNSLVDEQVLKGLSQDLSTLTITNGVDMEFFSPDSTRVEPDKLVFTGVMGYAPNEDAAIHFADDILPLVRRKRPDATFWIVGSEPSERLMAYGKRPGIHVTGKVDDVRSYVRSSALFVCPLRIGSGVKNKILAAMAMEKATVATPLSIDGLDVADDREVQLAGDPQTFADKVVRLLADEQEVRRLGANGLACVRRNYSWGAMGKALDEAIQTVAKASALQRSR
jgi:glycosyltransferase involved in cell wall biosynthesis